MKSCSKKILIDMIKPKKNTMHLLCRLTPSHKNPKDNKSFGFLLCDREFATHKESENTRYALKFPTNL